MLTNKFLKVKEIVDNRGFSIFFENLPLDKFHIVSMNPGAIRGNHVHDYTEIICVIGGKELAEILLESPQCVKRIVIDRDFQIIDVPPKLKHIIKNIGNKRFYLVCFAFDEEKYE